MFRIVKWIAGPAVALGMMTVGDLPQAEAGDGVSVRVGRFGLQVGNYGGYNRGYYSGHRSHYGGGHYGGGHYGGGHYGHGRVYPGVGGHYGHGYGRYHGGYHDTSHWDYHPPQLVPHRGHLDYVPGHYDLHRSGHWHH